MDIKNGLVYLAQGAGLLLRRELRLFVLLPLLINIIVFGLGIGLIYSYASGWVDAAVNLLPDWLAWAAWVLWLILTLLVAMTVFWGFSIIANIIAAPFNGLLSEKTQMLLTGYPLDGGGWSELTKMVPQTVAREFNKLLYYLPRVIILFILGWIPVINMVAPLLWLAFAAWMMAIQYVDYPMDNNKTSFKGMRHRLEERKLLHLSFGGGVNVLLLVPFVNFFVMPIAVVGATALWVEEHR